MRSRGFITIAAIGMVLGAAACGDDDETASGGSTTTPEDEPAVTTAPSDGEAVPDSIADRRWVLTDTITVGGEQPVSGDAEATIMFYSDGEVEVDTGCNSGGGEASFDGNIVTVSLAVTDMACVDDEVMNVERALVGVLGSSMSWSVSDDRLTLLPTDVSDSGLVLEDSGSSPNTTGPTDD